MKSLVFNNVIYCSIVLILIIGCINCEEEISNFKKTTCTQYSSTPFQYVTADVVGVFNDSSFSKNVDVVSLYLDYGIPWNTFMYGSTPPIIWSSSMNLMLELVNSWDLPVFLSLQMLSKGDEIISDDRAVTRSCPSVNITQNDAGEQQIEPFNDCTTCYNFDSSTNPQADLVKSAYLNYTFYMIDLFKPKYLNYAIDLNVYYSTCSLEDFQFVVQFANQVYDEVKLRHPNMTIFPSIQMESLAQIYVNERCYDQEDASVCILDGLSSIKDLKRDMFAVSTYPYLVTNGNISNWFSRVFDYLNETIAIASTGRISDNMQITGPRFNEIMAGISLGVLSLVIFLPFSCWFCCCLICSSKHDGYEEIPDPSINAVYHPDTCGESFVDCCCYPRRTKHTTKRKVTMVVGYGLFFIVLVSAVVVFYGNYCSTAYYSSEADATDYLKIVMETARKYDMPLVNWYSYRDMIPVEFMTACPCKLQGEAYEFCDYVRQWDWYPWGKFMEELNLKRYGTMGLRRYDGSNKTLLMDQWDLRDTMSINCTL